eukprot:g63955.t1
MIQRSLYRSLARAVPKLVKQLQRATAAHGMSSLPQLVSAELRHVHAIDVDLSQSCAALLDRLNQEFKRGEKNGMHSGFALLKTVSDLSSRLETLHSQPYNEGTSQGVCIRTRSRLSDKMHNTIGPEDHYLFGPEDHYLFVYDIMVTNQLEHDQIKLLRRRWLIHDLFQETLLVEGEGVLGKKPVIGPGDSMEYSSWCQIKSPLGTMVGSYQFLNMASGKLFDVPIPPFALLGLRNRDSSSSSSQNSPSNTSPQEKEKKR